jgi:hypothetical protein
MGTRGTGIRPLLWRFKQAILGGFVGCFVTVIGGNQVGAAIGDASAQYEFVSRPSMAIESVCVADPAIQIDVGLLLSCPVSPSPGMWRFRWLFGGRSSRLVCSYPTLCYRVR